MKKGIIFTKDKTEIDVFFLKAHVPPELGWQLGHQIGDGSDKNPILVDDETGKALMEDDIDCSEEPWGWNDIGELDVNENSAGGVDWPHALTSEGASLPIHPDDCDKVKGCGPCPVGHKGVQGTVGVKKDEADIFEVICECLEKFSVTDLNINDGDSRDILSITITRKVKNLLP